MKIHRTRRAAAAVAGLGVALALTSCATSGGSAPEEKSLEFWTINLQEGYQEYIEDLIADYEENNPGVTIEWVDVTDYQQTQSRLLAAITSGDVPDVVNVTPFILPIFAESGSVMALSEISDDVDSIAQQYTEGFWDAGVIDGEAYAIPYYGSAPALLYNKDIFERAGLDPNDPPENWAEVFETAKTIHAETGIPGFVHTLDDFNDAGNPIDIVAAHAGVELFNDDGTQAVFNTEAAVDHFQNFVDGVDEGWLSETSINGGQMDGARELAQGQVAMMFNGPWLLRWIEANSSPEVYENIALGDHPENPTGTINAFLQQLAIPTGSAHPEQSLDFARYVSGTVVELAQSAPVLPTLTEGVNDPAYRELFGADVLTSQPTQFFWPKHPQVAEMLDALRSNMQSAMLGEASTQEAFDAAVQEWNDLLP